VPLVDRSPNTAIEDVLTSAQVDSAVASHAEIATFRAMTTPVATFLHSIFTRRTLPIISAEARYAPPPTMDNISAIQ
jgi:hypothetical protein